MNSRLKIILLSLVLIWPFGQILEIPLFDFGPRLYFIDLLTVSLFLILLFDKPKWSQIWEDKLLKPIGLFVVMMWLSLSLSIYSFPSQGLFVAFLYLFRFTVYCSLYFALKKVNIHNLLKLTLISLGIFTTLGLIQYLFLPDTRFLYYLGFDDHFYRLIGTFFDPNYTGLALIIFTLLLLSQPKFKYFAVIPIIALALTYSRASYLVGLISFLYLLIRSQNKVYLLSIPLIALTIYFAPKPYGEGVNLTRTFSITSRIEDSRMGLELFKQKPLFGHGFNTLRSIKESDDIIPNRAGGGFSNSFVFILATTGLVGFLAYLNLLYHVFKITRPNPYLNASFFAFLVHSFFNNSLFYTWLLVLFWILPVMAYKKP